MNKLKEKLELPLKEYLNLKNIPISKENNEFTEEQQELIKKDLGRSFDNFYDLQEDFYDMFKPVLKLIRSFLINKEKVLEAEDHFKEPSEENKEAELNRIIDFVSTKELMSKKGLKVNINQVSNKPKTNILLSYLFNKDESVENKNSFITKEFSSQVKLTSEKFIAIMIFATANPLEVKIKIEKLLNKFLKDLPASDENLNDFKKSLFEGFKINFYSTSDSLILTVEHNSNIFKLITDICLSLADSLKKFKLNLNASLITEKSFDDLTFPQEGIMRTFTEGVKFSFEMSSNLTDGFSQLFAKRKNKLNLPYLFSLLNFNAELNISKGDLEESEIWKTIPDINIFDAENGFLAEFFKYEVKDFNEAFPFVKSEIEEIIKLLNSKMQLCIITPFGMANLKLEAKGLLDTWQTLNTIHMVDF